MLEIRPTWSLVLLPTTLLSAVTAPTVVPLPLSQVTAPASTTPALSQVGVAVTMLPLVRTTIAPPPTPSFAVEPTRLLAGPTTPATPVVPLPQVSAPAPAAPP